MIFFPGIFERRILLILEISYLILLFLFFIFIFSYIFSYHFICSHLHICSHLLISFYLLPSSHLLLFSLSHLLNLLPSCPLFLFYIFLKARGSANEAPRNASLSNEIRFGKIAILYRRSQSFRMK